ITLFPYTTLFRSPAESENLVVRQSGKRTSQHPDQSHLIERIHERSQERKQILDLARFEKRPAAAYQKWNAGAVKRALERFCRCHGPYQDGDVAIAAFAGIHQLLDPCGNQSCLDRCRLFAASGEPL